MFLYLGYFRGDYSLLGPKMMITIVLTLQEVPLRYYN